MKNKLVWLGTMVLLCFSFSVNAGWLDDTTATYIDDGDNVGIGTTTPAQKLEVSGIQRISRNSNGRVLEFYHSGNSWGHIGMNGGAGMDLSISGNQSLLFKTNITTSPLFVDDHGRIGIGLTNPTGTFQVAGQGNGSQSIKGITLGTSGLSDEWAHMELKGVQSGGGGIIDFGYPSDDYRGRISYLNDDEKMRFYADATLILTLEEDQVGIGTDAPTEKLEVAGTGIRAGGGLIMESRTTDYVGAPAGQMWLRSDLG